MITPWIATCMQVHTYPLNAVADRATAMALIDKRLDHWIRLIRSRTRTAGGLKQLYLFPEFALQGYPQGEKADAWIEKACLDIPGPQTERLQKTAAELKVYIGANAYWRDPDWPGRFFNTSFLIDDSGAIVLKYRRINTAQAGSPHDVWDRYLDKVGIEGAFPVARTALGNIAMMPCGEIMYPEAARMFMFRGAEVLLHPTSDFGAWDNHAWMSAKKVRAAENMLYLVSANTAGFRDAAGPENECAGNSQIIDWDGRVMAHAATAGECLRCHAMIDVEQVRLARGVPNPHNRLIRNRIEAYRPLYNAVSFLPANTAGGAEDKGGMRATWREAFAAMARQGIEVTRVES
jgi:predicted amidohydrolase